MSLESVNCSLVCCNYQKEQTKCSRNFRITAVVLGILLTGAGVGIAIGVGSFGWALVSAGIISFMIGSCCFYPKKEQSYYQSRPVQYVERPLTSQTRAQSILEPYQNTTQSILQKTEETKKDFEALLQARNKYVDSKIDEWKAGIAKKEKEEEQAQSIKTELSKLHSEILDYITSVKINSENLLQVEIKLKSYQEQLKNIQIEQYSHLSSVKTCIKDVNDVIEILSNQIEKFKKSAEQPLEGTKKPTTSQIISSTNLEKMEPEVEDWEKRAKALSKQITNLNLLSINKDNFEDYETKLDLLKPNLDSIKKEAETLRAKYPELEIRIIKEIAQIDEYLKRREKRIKKSQSEKAQEIHSQQTQQNSKVTPPQVPSTTSSESKSQVLMTKMSNSANPAEAISQNLHSLQSLQRQEQQEVDNAKTKVVEWEQKIDGLWHKLDDYLSKEITLDNLEDHKKQIIVFKNMLNTLENEYDIPKLKVIYNSAFKSRIDFRNKMLSNLLNILDAEIKRLEITKASNVFINPQIVLNNANNLINLRAERVDIVKEIDKQKGVWQQKINDLERRVINLHKKIILENLEECIMQKAGLQAELNQLENDPEIVQLKSSYSSAYKSEIDDRFKKISTSLKIMGSRIAALEKTKTPLTK